MVPKIWVAGLRAGHTPCRGFLWQETTGQCNPCMPFACHGGSDLLSQPRHIRSHHHRLASRGCLLQGRPSFDLELLRCSSTALWSFHAPCEVDEATLTLVLPPHHFRDLLRRLLNGVSHPRMPSPRRDEARVLTQVNFLNESRSSSRRSGDLQNANTGALES